MTTKVSKNLIESLTFIHTAIDTTSGRDKDFTFQDENIKRFKVVLNDVSLAGATSQISIQLITASGVISTGYYSISSIVLNGGATQAYTLTDGMCVVSQSTSAGVDTTATLDFVLAKDDGAGNHTWQSSHAGYWKSARTVQGGGTVTVTEPITGVRVTTSNASATFDNGFCNVIEEY